MNELNHLDPISRRQFAERTAKAALGLSLVPAADTVLAEAQGKAKHVIYLYMAGGMTHLDTFDPKPGADTQGQTGAVETGVPGIKLSEYLPGIAQRFKDVAVVRTLTQKTGSHGGGSYWMQTGYQESAAIRHPNMGAWAQKILGPNSWGRLTRHCQSAIPAVVFPTPNFPCRRSAWMIGWRRWRG